MGVREQGVGSGKNKNVLRLSFVAEIKLKDRTC